MSTDVRLGDSDRERFGCEEWLPLDLADISVADLGELSDRFAFDIDDWPEPLMGEVAFEDAGNPDAKRKQPYWQMQAVVWMALRQSGHMVSWDDAGTVKSPRTKLRTIPEPGKGDPEPSPSETSDASTTPPSDTSSPE